MSSGPIHIPLPFQYESLQSLIHFTIRFLFSLCNLPLCLMSPCIPGYSLLFSHYPISSLPACASDYSPKSLYDPSSVQVTQQKPAYLSSWSLLLYPPAVPVTWQHFTTTQSQSQSPSEINCMFDLAQFLHPDAHPGTTLNIYLGLGHALEIDCFFLPGLVCSSFLNICLEKCRRLANRSAINVNAAPFVFLNGH